MKNRQHNCQQTLNTEGDIRCSGRGRVGSSCSTSDFILYIGIPGHQIIIALEPEATSVYCNYLKTVRPSDISKVFQEPLPGTKYMVVDIGGIMQYLN